MPNPHASEWEALMAKIEEAQGAKAVAEAMLNKGRFPAYKVSPPKTGVPHAMRLARVEKYIVEYICPGEIEVTNAPGEYWFSESMSPSDLEPRGFTLDFQKAMDEAVRLNEAAIEDEERIAKAHRQRAEDHLVSAKKFREAAEAMKDGINPDSDAGKDLL